jgi:hypothetical protein
MGLSNAQVLKHPQDTLFNGKLRFCGHLHTFLISSVNCCYGYKLAMLTP